MTNSYMHHDAHIFVTGHRGLVGSAILRALQRQGYQHITVRTKEQLDLTDQAAVRSFFADQKPDYVFMAAAKVGGIVANDTYTADFSYINQVIQSNIIYSAWQNNVKRLLFLGSSCLYPRICPQPIEESYLLTGLLEPTNKAYALAKIAGISLCESFNKQHGTKYVVGMPTSVYGPNDNYDLQASHVIPALMRKMHEAKIKHSPSVEVWGTGDVRREFIHSDDLANAAVFLLNLPESVYDTLIHCPTSGALVNIGYGKDISIKELVELIKQITEYTGKIQWDTSKPDGTPQKLLNTHKINQTGWKPTLSLADELKKIYLSKFM